MSIRIEKPVAAVFAVLKDVGSAPRWYSAVHAVVPITAGPPGSHFRYAFSREIGGQRVENIVEITEFEDGERLTLSSVSGPTPFTYRYRLTADGTATNLSLEGTISGTGFGGPLALFAPLVSQFFEAGMRTNLARLKRLLEMAEPA